MGIFRKQQAASSAPIPPPPPSAAPPPPVSVVGGVQAALAHLAEPPPGKRLAWSPLECDVTGADFVWSEASRPLTGDRSLEEADGLDRSLRSAHGHGLQRTVMCAEDRPVLGDDYNGRELHVDPISGAMAAVAGLSHHSFGLTGGLDLGLRDGRNLFTWNDQVPECMGTSLDSLYVGNTRTGRLEMDALGGQVGGLSLSPTAGRAAWIEWRGTAEVPGIASPGFVFEQDLATGARRLVTVISDFSGSDPVRYSPDGAWLLVGSSLAIRLADMAILDLPAALSSAWAPALGASMVLRVIGREEDGFRLASLDLASATEQDLGPIEVAPDALVLYLNELDVHPSGGQALCVSPHGFPTPYRDGQGARGKLQILDLESRRLTPVTSPTVPGFDHIERTQERPHWIVDRRGDPVQLADQLEAQLRSPTGLDAAPAGMVGDIAMMLLQRCLTDLEPDRPTRNPSRVRVELLRAMRSLQEINHPQADYVLSQVREFTFPLAMQAMGRIDPINGIDWSGRPMVWLDAGLQALEEGTFHEYSFIEHAYLPS